MIRRFIAIVLLNSFFAAAAAVGVSAQTIDGAGPRNGIRAELQAQYIAPVSDKKVTLRSYEEEKRNSKKFSTTTKILIGVGIAAAAVGVFFLAASRDKVRLF